MFFKRPRSTSKFPKIKAKMKNTMEGLMAAQILQKERLIHLKTALETKMKQRKKYIKEE